MKKDGMARLERAIVALADAQRETNERLEQTNERLEQTTERLERVMLTGFDTLADLQREANERLAQTNQRLDGAVSRLDDHEQLLVALVGGVSSLNERFDNFLSGAHRQEHDTLRDRVERLEKHVGIGPPRS